jgi:hypothetical protein
MGRIQLLVERAKRAYSDIDARHEETDKFILAAGKALPDNTPDFIDLIAEDATLLTDSMVLRIAPGSSNVSPLEMIRLTLLERVAESLREWANAANGEWRCQSCGRMNQKRETCEVCWAVRA